MISKPTSPPLAKPKLAPALGIVSSFSSILRSLTSFPVAIPVKPPISDITAPLGIEDPLPEIIFINPPVPTPPNKSIRPPILKVLGAFQLIVSPLAKVVDPPGVAPPPNPPAPYKLIPAPKTLPNILPVLPVS